MGKNLFKNYKDYTLNRIEKAQLGLDPYNHCYIEEILHPDFYTKLKLKCFKFRESNMTQNRIQDSKEYVNSRCNLIGMDDSDINMVTSLFSDFDIKRAFLNKFYLTVSPELVESIKIHEEYEFVYTQMNRIQNIHTDIPPKFLSFVFYFPEKIPSEEDMRNNSTVLYDKSLSPHYPAKYKDNSVCIFAQHFNSYHGFDTISDRTALVMFYVNDAFLNRFKKSYSISNLKREMDFFKKVTEERLIKYPLREYNLKNYELSIEKNKCRINAPDGRVSNKADEHPENVKIRPNKIDRIRNKLMSIIKK